MTENQTFLYTSLVFFIGNVLLLGDIDQSPGFKGLMMLVLTTHNKLIDSKKYFTSRKAMMKHLNFIISLSNELRNKMYPHELGELSWGKWVSKEDMDCSIWVMEINTLENPEWKNIVGAEIEVPEDVIAYRKAKQKELPPKASCREKKQKI